MRGELPLHLHSKVFDEQIRPIIEYASDIWCQKNAHRGTGDNAIDVPEKKR